MRTRKLFSWLTAMALLGTLVSLSGPTLTRAASGKIAQRVLDDTANGGPTEALVVLTEQADLSAAAALATKEEKGRFVFNALRDAAARAQAPLLAWLDARGVPHQSFYIVNMIKVTGDRALMQELADRADVERIEANPAVRASLPAPTGVDTAGNAPRAVEWNVARVKAPDVWALGYTGAGRVVAGADTGVDWTHPALKTHYRGWNGTAADHNYNWHDATAAHSTTPVDPQAHGTFTVSQMVGDDGAGNQVGVAPGAKWIGCRNMDAGGVGSPATYTECFEWLMAPYPIGGNPSQGDPSKAPDSINNSWGCPSSEGCSVNTLKAVVEAVRAAGIFPAVAAGNSGSRCSTISDPPGLYDDAVTVGATTNSNAIASFSSRGPITQDGSNRIKPDISAPGQSIRGAVPGTGYQSGWSGTSMATPHVAGAVALVWQARPSLAGNVDATEALFTSTATHKRSSQTCGGRSGRRIPNNTFGYGILNILAAAQKP
ncbi:MAG: S8 family serine peptidase [Chloroflexi bacterium]|nr:S8 family serine peptidase [Chloroflexota bacterium]